MSENKVTWTTKDGRVLVVDEIEDIQHLRNIVKYLINKKESDWEDYEFDGYCSFGDIF